MIIDNEFDAQNMDSVNIVSENAVMKTVNENIKSIWKTEIMTINKEIFYSELAKFSEK